MNDDDHDEQQVIEQVTARLMNRFPQLDSESVRGVSTEIVHEFATAKIKTYVGPLAEHNARDVLRHANTSDL